MQLFLHIYSSGDIGALGYLRIFKFAFGLDHLTWSHSRQQQAVVLQFIIQNMFLFIYFQARYIGR